MSLIKNIGLSVRDYNITLTSPLKLYKRDVVTLIFTLEEFGYEIRTEPITGMTYRVERKVPINPLSGVLFIETPKGKDSVNHASIVDNTIVFKLVEEHTLEVGLSKMQIVLKGQEEHRVALPPFDFEVRDTIADESFYDYNGILTHSYDVIVTHEDDAIIFTETNNFRRDKIG